MFKHWSPKRSNQIELTVANSTVIRVLALVLVSVIFLAVLRRASYALILIFTAFFLSLALDAPVRWIAERLPGKRRGSRAIGTAVSFLLVIVVLGAFLVSTVPPIVRQTNSFITAAPALVSDVRDQNSGIGNFVRRYHLESQVQTVSNQLSERLKNATGAAVATASRIGSSVFATLTILVLTFMMLIEGPQWLSFFYKMLPVDRRRDAQRLGNEMYRVIRGYVNGQVILAALAALLIMPMLFVLGINYPIALVFVIFICGLIPMVGHTIGALIVALVALFHSLPAALIILAYYILYQQIETYIIQPRIQANTTNLSPLLVFVAVVIGVSFGGLLGGLVAIPLMGCLRVLVLDQLERRHLLPEAEVAKVSATKKP